MEESDGKRLHALNLLAGRRGMIIGSEEAWHVIHEGLFDASPTLGGAAKLPLPPEPPVRPR